jgi:hypothetical protein
MIRSFTRPFTLYGHVTLLTDTDLIEYVCQQDNKDVIHITRGDPRHTRH